MPRRFWGVVLFLLVCSLVPSTINAQDAASVYKRGNDWYAKGDYDKAIADYDEFIRLSPNFAPAYDNRGSAWARKGELDKAIADFNRAIELQPNYAPTYNNRGNTLRKKHKCDEAIADYNQALRLDPQLVAAYNGRGNAWCGKSEYDKAIADYKQALRLNPKYVHAYRNLADIQATCPDPRYRDGKAALANANKAYELDGGKNPMCIDALAASYAEIGDFEKARQWEAKALKVLQQGKYATDEVKRELRSHLELYKQNKACRREANKTGRDIAAIGR